MPTWGQVLEELGRPENKLPNGMPDCDGVRRRYLAELNALTGRATIIYYADWFNKRGVPASIGLDDMQGMMEVCRGVGGSSLDLILHSPGGSPEATASIVRYLRRQFTDIRVFIPLAAMSAATMWALACDRIVMGAHSQLGPIDPQMSNDSWQAPARAIILQFEQAKEECRDPQLLGAWIPILQQYGPALIQQCGAAEKLAKELVREWLQKYMFAGQDDPEALAISAAEYFADYEQRKSHSLGIDRDQAKSVNITVDDLESDAALQDAVLSVHHAAMLTMQGAPFKLIENHVGRTYVKFVQMPTAQGAPLPT